MFLLSDKIIDKLISNKFEIDCIEIKLIQKIDDGPLVYEGPGAIFQDEFGQLNLKMYSRNSELKKEFNCFFKNRVPGKLVERDSYFSLKAIDMSGNEWHSDDIRVSPHMSLPAQGQVVKAKLRSIETGGIGSSSELNYLTIFMPGKYSIPCNEIEELPNGGRSLNRSVFSANNINFELKENKEYLVIRANASPEYLQESACWMVNEALSIITGIIMWPVAIMQTQQESSSIKIRSKFNKTNKEFSKPFKVSSPEDIQSFISFVEKYLSAMERPHSELFGYWHKIQRSWQTSLIDSALTLTVAIEGILKVYYEGIGNADEEIMRQAKAAKKILTDNDNDEFEDRIKERLLSSIGNLNQTSPKNALYKLREKNLVTDHMVKEWDILRNQSAHADKLEEDSEKFQQHIDSIFTNIALFFRLIFIVIGYNGKYIDYSSRGNPEKVWKGS